MTDQLDMFGAPQPTPTANVVCPTCHGGGSVTAEYFNELMERPGQVAAGAPSTSRRAGTTPRKGTQRWQILKWLSHYPQYGLTARMLSGLIDTSPNQVATRLGELHDDTFVEYLRDPESRNIMEETTTGHNKGMVHVITDAGRLALGIA